MKVVTKGLFTVGLATWFSFTVLTALAQSPPGQKPFVVFDGMDYFHKPDSSKYGIRPITLVYADRFGLDWFKEADRLPDLQAVQAVAREALQKGHIVVLDIEHWPLTGSPDSVRDNLTKYMTVLEGFRAAAPGVPIGYYGPPPIIDYGRSLRNISDPLYQSWMAENDQIRPLAEVVDVLFPSVYTFSPDQVKWKKYAIAQIAEARRYGNGKPVYVFLWPQYHESANPTSLVHTYLPADYWLLQLQTARDYADGIVLWGGASEWVKDARWWKVTIEFMRILNQSQLAAPTGLRVR
ncbi:MAG: hypothetical protein ABIU05_00435 [Nitrospirales bacterium]